MKLMVRPIVPADFDAARQYYTPETGDLVAPATEAFWPVDPADLATAKARVDWSLQQQKDLFENDPSQRTVVVIDTDKDELVAIGRWHEYRHGYEAFGDYEAVGAKDRNEPATFPEGFAKDLFLTFYDSCMELRRDWQGTGHCWVLTTIVTRKPYRKHGAGSLILKWGLEQAKKDGVPAFLEAAPDAKGLYEAHGFKQVGTQPITVAPGVSFDASRMRADP